MLEDPRMLVMVADVVRRREIRVQTCTQKRKRSKIALGDDWYSRVQQECSRNPDTSLPAPFSNKPATVRNDLTSAGCAHVGENRELRSLVLSERQHCFGAGHHRGGQISAMLVKHP